MDEKVEFLPQGDSAIEPWKLLPTPQKLVCPNCGHKVMSSVELKGGAMTYLTCLTCALLGCVLGCCLIPFGIKSLKDVHHTCPECGNLIGVRKAWQ